MVGFEPYEGSADEWDGLLASYPDHQIFQTSAWLSFLQETQNGEPVRALLRQNGGIVGCFAGLVVRKFGLRLLGSPLPGWTTSYMGIRLRDGVHKNEALAALVQYAFRRLGCVHLEMQDLAFSLEETGGLGFECNTVVRFALDLTPSDDELLAMMRKNTRRDIRRAERNGVVVEVAHDEAFADEFYDQLQDVFARQALVPTYDRRRVRLLVRYLLPTGRLLLLRARDPDGRCIATGVFPAMNRTMYFWGGASWRQHQKLLPNEAIQWHAIKYWKERGMQLYDMVGGGEYKRKYGPQEFHSDWLRKSRFRILETARKLARRAFDLKQKLLGWRKN